MTLTPLRKSSLAVGSLLLVAGYLGWAALDFQASRLAATSERDALQRAVRLQPSNAQFHYKLGRFLFFVAADFPASIAAYKEAARLNPYDARHWLDLAAAYNVTGDLNEQDRVLRNAIRAEPMTPRVAWEAANWFLIQGHTEEALRQFRVVLETDPDASRQALELCWRSSHDAQAILDKVVPPDPDAHFAFLSVLMEKNETQPAIIVWSRLLSLQQPVEPKKAFPYVQYLLAQREVGRAVEAWNALLAENPALRPYQSPGNSVVNGSFEHNLLNAGLDWRYEARPQVEVSLDTTRFHEGNLSLLVEFQGGRTPDAGISQWIPVEPDISYQFSGYMMTEGLETANGLRFAILDADNGTTYVLTDDLLGSNLWRQSKAEFRTGQDTRLVFLTIIRDPNLSLIRGKVWIDDLQLTRKERQ